MGLKLVKHLFIKPDIREDNIIVNDYIYLGFIWNPSTATFNNYYIFIDQNNQNFLVNQLWSSNDNEEEKEIITRFSNLRIHSQINLAYISSRENDERKSEIQHILSSFNANTSYFSDLDVKDILDDYYICEGYKKLIDGQIKSRSILIPNTIMHKIEITNYSLASLSPIINDIDSNKYRDIVIIRNINMEFLFFDKTFWSKDNNIVVMVYKLSHPDFKEEQYALIRVQMGYELTERIKSNSNLYDFSKYHKGSKFIDMGNNRLCIFSDKVNNDIIKYAGFHYKDKLDNKFKIYITNSPMDKLLKQVLI